MLSCTNFGNIDNGAELICIRDQCGEIGHWSKSKRLTCVE
jgi:hypothetical protein